MESVQFTFPGPNNSELFIEYTADTFIRLMGKIQMIMAAHGSFADSMALLLAIHGYTKNPVCFHGPAIAFGNVANEEQMVSKIMAAVFTDTETSVSEDGVRLVLTKHSVSRINVATRESRTILEYAEESDPEALHSLRVVISAKDGGTDKVYRFVPKGSWPNRRYVENVE